MKINKRLVYICIVSLVLAMLVTFFVYKAIKASVQPEKTEKILYFKNKLDKGSVITEKDVYVKDTPISLIPQNAIKNTKEVVDKTLLINAMADDYVLENKLISRGEIKVEAEDMFHMGLKVDSLSNFIGTQLKEGDIYGLLFISLEGIADEELYKVKLLNMVDNTGKIIVQSGDVPVEAINIALDKYEHIIEIAEKKKLGYFELIKAPEEWNKYKK